MDNVAELKRRLTPAIKELEAIGYLEPLDLKKRFYKVKAGVWRVTFQAGPSFGPRLPAAAAPAEVAALPAPPPEVFVARAEETALVQAYYALWTPGVVAAPGENDLRQARAVVEAQGAERALALMPLLVQVVRRKWPDCKSFSGAAAKYLADAVTLATQAQRRQETKTQAQAFNQETKSQVANQEEDRQQREARWQALHETQRRDIEAGILRKHPHLGRYPAILRERCLSAM